MQTASGPHRNRSSHPMLVRASAPSSCPIRDFSLDTLVVEGILCGLRPGGLVFMKVAFQTVTAVAGACVFALTSHSATIHVPADQPTIQAGIGSAVKGVDTCRSYLARLTGGCDYELR